MRQGVVRSNRSPIDLQALSKRVAAITRARSEGASFVEWGGIEGPDHIKPEGFAKRLGIRVVRAPLRRVRAQLTVVNGVATIEVADWLTPQQQRWAIIHELGHFRLKHPSPPAAQLGLPDPPNWRSPVRDFEAEADIFAASVLMPTEAVCRICDTAPMTLDVARRLADTWHTSLIAAAIRITELSLRRCAAVLSQHGEIRWVSPSIHLVSHYNHFVPGQRLDPRSLAGQFFAHGAALPDEPRCVPSSAWLAAFHEPLIQEHSISVGTDTVLTMLWFPGDVGQRPRRWMGLTNPLQIMCLREASLDFLAGGQFAADEYRLTRSARLPRSKPPALRLLIRLPATSISHPSEPGLRLWAAQMPGASSRLRPHAEPSRARVAQAAVAPADAAGAPSAASPRWIGKPPRPVL